MWLCALQKFLRVLSCAVSRAPQPEDWGRGGEEGRRPAPLYNPGPPLWSSRRRALVDRRRERRSLYPLRLLRARHREGLLGGATHTRASLRPPRATLAAGCSGSRVQLSQQVRGPRPGIGTALGAQLVKHARRPRLTASSGRGDAGYVPEAWLPG